MRVVVLGLGNVLLGDDALGVHAVRRLNERLSHPHLECVDGGTLGLSLLPLMEDATHLLILDAIGIDAPPGTIVELPPRHLHAFPASKFSVHDVALPDLLSLLLFRKAEQAPQVWVMGAVPERLDANEDLSQPVRNALGEVVTRAEHIVQDWLSGYGDSLG